MGESSQRLGWLKNPWVCLVDSTSEALPGSSFGRCGSNRACSASTLFQHRPQHSPVRSCGAMHWSARLLALHLEQAKKAAVGAIVKSRPRKISSRCWQAVGKAVPPPLTSHATAGSGLGGRQCGQLLRSEAARQQRRGLASQGKRAAGGRLCCWCAAGSGGSGGRESSPGRLVKVGC